MKKEIFEFLNAEENTPNGDVKYDLVNCSPTHLFYYSLEGEIARQRKEYDKEIRLIFLKRICECVVEKCVSSLALTGDDIKATSKKYKQVIQFTKEFFSAWYISVKNETGSALSQLETEDELVALLVSMLEKKLINHAYPFNIDDIE